MTAKDVINFSAKIANIMAAGETLNDDEYTDALAAFNAMLSNWNTEQITVYTIVNFQHALTGGQQSYTIGSGGNFATNRPTKIVGASVIQSNGLSTGPLKIIDVEAWNAIAEKGVSALAPQVLYCDYDYPLSKIYLHPKPSSTPTLDLWMWEELTGFQNLTDVFDLPPGYLEAIWYNLAVHLAIMFGKPISPGLQQEAASRKNAIAQLNVSNQQAAPSALPTPQQQQ